MNNNITPYPSSVPIEERMKITGSRPIVCWMSGLSGSGKSTIASLTEEKLIRNGYAAVMIDGDTVRSGLCAGLGFSPEDRHENLRRIAHLAKITALSGQVVLVCTISPDKESRDNARAIIEPEATFVEVYTQASVEVCASRDPKGLYKRAMAGEIPHFTGVSAPYEAPESPDILIDTANHSAEFCVDQLYHDILRRICPPNELLHHMIHAACLASAKIMEIYNDTYEVSFKEDSSPLTSADIASNEVITGYLRAACPAYSILSEEEVDSTARLRNNAGVFIIDPIDGTKEFINRNGEFCVSIGFASKNRVTAGVIAVPAKGWLYYAFEGMGAYKCQINDVTAEPFTIGIGKKLHVSDRWEKVIVVASRSHMDKQTKELLTRNQNRILDTLSVGSCLKGCYIAEGLADVHYRYGAFMKEWDTAAMEIICREAGASFTDSDGNELVANRADPINRRGFIILNNPKSALDTSGIE